MSRPELPQQVIDEALCIGANDRNSRLIICAYFMKDHTPEENAAFLAKHYGTNRAGFYINDREYALWYDPRVSGYLPDAVRKIAMLRFCPGKMPPSVSGNCWIWGGICRSMKLDRVADYERKTLAESLALTARDFSEEARDAGYAPTLRLRLQKAASRRLNSRFLNC